MKGSPAKQLLLVLSAGAGSEILEDDESRVELYGIDRSLAGSNLVRIPGSDRAAMRSLIVGVSIEVSSDMATGIVGHSRVRKMALRSSVGVVEL